MEYAQKHPARPVQPYIISLPRQGSGEILTAFLVTRALAEARPATYSHEKGQDIDVLQARAEAWRSVMEAQNKGPKPKREERDYDEETDTFVEAAETCWSDNEDYFSTVEEQPPVWPIVLRCRARGTGRKRVKIVV
jgi:hypothetical protein